MPLSVPTVNCRKCLCNSAGKLFNRREEGLGHRPFAFRFLCFFFFPSSPSHFTTVRRPLHPQSPQRRERESRCCLSWPSTGLSWSLWQPDSGYELRPIFELDTNYKPVLFCSVLFCFFLIKSQEKCFWECGRPLWTYKASSGSVAPSPPSLPVSYSTSQISDSLIFGDIVVNHGDTYLTVTRHTPAILGQPPMYLSYDAPLIVPLGSHFTGWTSDCCCPSHWIQRMVGTPCPADRSSYHTGSGV